MLHTERNKAFIVLPGSPYWNVFKRFGRDESIALIISVVFTSIISIFVSSAVLLAIAGPLVEKIGFFPAHFKEAYSRYLATPKKERKSLSYYFRDAVKNGSTSLIEDILVHDPLYAVLMFGGLIFYPASPVWLLSGASFVIAVFLVAALEIWYTELKYSLFKNNAKKAGFKVHHYYESRFMLSSKKDPNEVLEKISKRFKLNERKNLEYHDLYLDSKLSFYSGRKPRLRLRQRSIPEGGWMQTVQMIYTRPREVINSLDQYRYFPNKREKIYFELKQKMPSKIEDIKDKEIKKYLTKIKAGKDSYKVEFKRKIVHNDELMVSADQLPNKDFYFIEIKTYQDIGLLLEAMKYVMKEFPVVQTTQSKIELDSISIFE